MTLLYSETLYAIYRYSAGWSLFFYVLLAIVSLYFYKSFKGSYKLLFILFIGYFLFEFSYYASVTYFGLENNLFIDHPYLFFSALILAVFYNRVLKDEAIKWGLKIGASLLLIGIVFFFFYQDGFLGSPKLSIAYDVLFLVLFLLVQRKLLISAEVRNLKLEPLYWFNTAFLIYTSYILLFSLVNPFIVEISDDMAFITGTIRNVIEPIYLILLCIGVIKMRKSTFPIGSL